MQTANRLWSKIRRLKLSFPAGQGGFTLIELLVVVTILGILAAVVTVNVARFAGRGQESANEAERDNVQLAIDSLMTQEIVTAVDTPSDAVSFFGSGGGSTPLLTSPESVYLYKDFLRQENTSMAYCWDQYGEVTKQVDPEDAEADKTCP